MSTKSFRAMSLPETNSSPLSLDLEDGSLSKFWSGLERIISGSPDRKIVINVTISYAHGGGATVNNIDKRRT